MKTVNKNNLPIKIIHQESIAEIGLLSIRYPTPEDASIMTHYINELSNENTFITFQGEQMTIAEEEKFLQSQVEKIKNKTSCMLLAFANDQLVGIGSVQSKDKIAAHVGILGISISKEYRGKGLGKILFRVLLEESQKIENLKVITLEVFATNTKAINLYQSFGFQEYGRLPQGIQYKKEFIDEILMYKNIS